MAYTVNGTVSSVSSFLLQQTANLSTTLSGTAAKNYSKTLSTSDITKVYFTTLSVTTTPTVLDLTALTDIWAQSISFVTVKHIQVANGDATNSVTVGGGTTPVFSALPAITAGGCTNLTTNLTVGVSTNNLKLVSSAGTVSVDLIIVGT